MAQLLSDGEVMRHSFASPMSQAEARSYLLSALNSYKKYGYGIYGLIYSETKEFIGYCGFTHYEDLDGKIEVELGYRLLPQYWGKGIATEAAKALLSHGRTNLGLNRVISLIRKGNEASINVAIKAGASYEKEIPNNGHSALVYVYGKGN